MLKIHATEPRGWLVVAIPGVVILVEASPVRVFGAEELLAALKQSDPIPAALELLTAGGFSAMPSFALLEHRGQSAHFVVRGNIDIAFTGPGGARNASGAGITTWSEQLISGVDGFAVGVAGADGGDTLPLGEGAAWADRVEWGAADASAGVPAEAPAPAKAPQTRPVPQETLLPTVADEDSLPFPDETSGYDHLFGTTVMKSVESAAVRPQDQNDADEQDAPDADADQAGDHDGLTMMSGDIAELRRRAAQAGGAAQTSGAAPADGAPAARHPSPAAADPQFELQLPDGRSEPLDRPIIVGRSPSANKVSGTELPRLITVGGADPDISRNHVRFTVEGGTVVITDLHSRNGTLMALPGRAPQKLREGEPTSALAGTVVDLGGGIRITVTEAAAAAGR